MSSEETVEVLVIGAGPGGYTAAFYAADLGMETALVDPRSAPGGVCLHQGCIPSKALLHAARLIEEAEAASEYGLDFGEPTVDLKKLRRWKNRSISTLTGGLGKLAVQRKIKYIQGKAEFLDPHSVQVVGKSGESRTIRFERAVLATGSHPNPLPGAPTGSARFMNSTAALKLEEVPDRLLVVGGGYIGLELGSVYAALGSRVTLVEAMSGVLSGVDRDLVRPLAKSLETKFERVYLNTRIVECEEIEQGVGAALEGPECSREDRQLYDKVLYSVGRRPNVGGLNLEAAGLRIDAEGFVPVGPDRRTDQPHLFAVGDLTGPPMLAHKAFFEARVAIDAMRNEGAEFAPKAIPSVVFTDPEIATCGLSETEAKASGRKVEVARYPWSAVGRAVAVGANAGLTKWILDPESGRLLGAGIVGRGAGELIAEAVVAIENEMTAGDLKRCIHPHPTLSESLLEGAEMFFGNATHIHRPRKKNGRRD